MNIPRVMAWSARIRATPPRYFNIATFQHPHDDGGTVRCSACIAASMPEFNLAGLSLLQDEIGMVEGFALDGEEYRLNEFFRRGRSALEVMAKFFDVPYSLIARWCLMEFKAGPTQIADMMDKAIADEMLTFGTRLAAAREMPPIGIGAKAYIYE